jgi:hypothetical protein
VAEYVVFAISNDLKLQNYPGNLSVTLTYVLKPTNELHIRFSATTDIATPVNLTNVFKKVCVCVFVGVLCELVGGLLCNFALFLYSLLSVPLAYLLEPRRLR